MIFSRLFLPRQLCLFSFPRYCLALMDTTVFPSNAKALTNSIQCMSTILAMSNKHLGHVQLPIAQASANTTALISHRRKLEDGLVGCRLDTASSVVLQFAKPSDSTASDRRGGIQNGYVLAQDPKACLWEYPQVIGPLSLVRVSDMLGYDPDSRPSPSARAEQKLKL